jgi:hypothetical protein
VVGVSFHLLKKQEVKMKSAPVTSEPSAASPSFTGQPVKALEQTSVKVDGCFCEVKQALIDLREVQALTAPETLHDIVVLLRGGGCLTLPYGHGCGSQRESDFTALKTAWKTFKNPQVKPGVVEDIGDESSRIREIISKCMEIEETVERIKRELRAVAEGHGSLNSA